MKTSGSFWARGVMMGAAMAALACGSRSDLDSLSEQSGLHSGGAKSGSTQGGAKNSGGQTLAVGGTSGVHSSSYRTSAATGGTKSSGGSRSAGGSKPTGGSNFGGTRNTGGSKPTAGGTVNIGGTWSGGGSKPTAGGTTSFGGGTRSVGGSKTTPGGTWSAGGTTRTGTFSAGTTSIGSLGGHTATGATTSLGGFSAGGTQPTGGTRSTGGMSALPWTSVCSIGLTECGAGAGASCVDTQTDVGNCGYCGHGCQAGWHCDAGECRAPACKGRFTFGPNVFDMRYGTYTYLTALIAADFNQDGLLDLAADDNGTSRVSVVLGTQQWQASATAYYATSSYPVSLASGDFNGDGKLDIVTITAPSQGGISVLLGNGDGTFATHIDSGPFSQATRVAVGDLNGDKFADLVTDSALTNGLQVFIGNGDGTFASPVLYVMNGSISSLTVADLNGDAWFDVAATDASNGSVAVLLNDGKGAGKLSAAIEYAVGADDPRSLTVGDVNKDNKPDILVGCYNPSAVVVMLGDGTGALSTSLAYTTSGSDLVMLGDLNRDGNPDIVLLEPEPSGSFRNVGVRLGLGTGAFGKETFYAFAQNMISPVVGDFDRDGLPDVAAVDPSSGKLIVLAGKGDGTFGDAVRYANAECAQALTLGDVSRDGVLDLIAAGYSSFNVYLGPIKGLESPSAGYTIPASQVSLGDLDGDGLVDLVSRLQSYGPISVVFGAGAGQFGDRLDIAAGNPSSVVISDTNHDGWQDIVSFDSNSYTVNVSQNLGGRRFSRSSAVLKSDFIYEMAMGDLNGDQLPDLLMGTASGLQVALATGADAYASPVSATQNASANVVKLADLNGDGRVDVITATWTGGVTVLLGQGNGSLQVDRSYATGNLYALTVDDVNGDGFIDIVANDSGNTVALLLGNGDGTFSTEVAAGALWGSLSLSIGDINGDGWPDIALPDVYSSPCQVNILYGKCR